MGVMAVAAVLLYYGPLTYLVGHVPIIFNDSPGYITFSPMRTAGYPSVLYLSRLIGAGLTGVVIGQIGVFVMSVGYLSASLRRQCSARIVVVVCAVIVFNPFALFHFAIMSDSLTYSLLLIIIGLSVDTVFGKQRIRCLALLSLSIGLAISLRPASWGFVIILSLLIIHVTRQGGAGLFKGTCAALVPLLVVACASELTSYAVNGREKTSPAPYHFFAKSFLVSSGPAPTRLDRVGQSLWTVAETQGSGLRQILDRCPSESVRAATTVRIERAVVWQYVAPVVLPDVRRIVSGSGTNGHSLVLEVGLRRIIASPMQFLRVTWDEYLMLWKPYSERALSLEADSCIRTNTATFPSEFGALPESGIVTNHAINSAIPKSRAIYVAFELLWAILSLVAVTLIVVPITYMWLALRTRQPDPTLLIACVFGIAVHGCLVLDALTAPAEGRYLLLLVPMIGVSIVFFVARFNKARGRLTGHSIAP